MAEIVPMPKLGFDMAEGKLIRKVVQEGQPIKKGEVLAEVETDKATLEVEAYASGVVKGWLVEEGQAVPVGANMVVIAAPDENVDMNAIRAQSGLAAAPAVKPAPSSPAAQTAASGPATLAPKSNGGTVPPAVAEGGFIRISPIARRMADELGLDVRQIKGTGPEGRITKRDVEAFAQQAKAAPPPAPTPILIPVSHEDTKVPLTKLRSAIARRMTESKTSVPHFYVTSEIDMGLVMDLRKQLNALLGESVKLSVNDFIVKAAALALRQFPNLNASFAPDGIVRYGRVNIGNAVATDNGLLTVVVHDADAKSLAQISTEVKAMAARARAGKVKPEDIEGSTFTISNLGMYEVDSFVAIINPPNAAILAVGSASEVPVVKDGALAVGWRMKATISADHRVTDGAEAAQYMQAFKKNLEEPLRLML
ncbi:MAG TPA: dihydrolipoamide acetyltransferase family protein [Anaerolineales bacterium]|nr:dihydrolipoamide acetyltransferase family protein [Anaerolineales bacterium]